MKTALLAIVLLIVATGCGVANVDRTTTAPDGTTTRTKAFIGTFAKDAALDEYTTDGTTTTIKGARSDADAEVLGKVVDVLKAR